MATDEASRPTFADWTNRLKVYSEYIKALADYKQAEAEAALKYAEAAGQWEKARALRFALQQLARDFAELHKLTVRYRHDAAKLRERESQALILVRGRPTSLWVAAWSAYLWFQTRALLEATSDLYAIEVPSQGRDAKFFVHQKGVELPCVALPEDVTSALGMMSWLREQRQLPRVGSEPHRSMMQLFREINGVVTASIAQMQEAIAAMRKGTFDAWKPNAILGITEPTKRARVEWSMPPPPRLAPQKRSGRTPGNSR